MDANKAEWYGIIRVFVAGLLQIVLCYALFTLSYTGKTDVFQRNFNKEIAH